LSENPVGRGPPHNPGQGGWPTIRYFNKETGIEGGNYEKKTSAPMCTELGGDGDLLMDYVEEAGMTSLCDAITKTGCSDREIGYIDKMSQNSIDDVSAQFTRLTNMESGSMKPELKDWLNKRKKILSGLIKNAVAASEQEL